MISYDPKQESKHILDANNLYGYAMSLSFFQDVDSSEYILMGLA